MKYLQIRVLLILFILLAAGFLLWSFVSSQSAAGTQTDPSPQPKEVRIAVVVSPAPTILPTPTPTPTPAPSVMPQPHKSVYTIAAFGDSMVDTMGEHLEYLDKQMMARYPKTEFKFYNYGIGSQNVVEANRRFSEPFIYQSRNYLPLDEINPDVIIISSFAYNPLSPYDNAAYTASLKDLLTKAKQTNARVYLLAEIAPLKEGFGKGVGGVNWDDQKVKTHLEYIFQNLDSAVNIASQTNTPLINAYKKSQVDGKYGNKLYVGNHDGIHPSVEGEVFMATLIAQTIKLP